MDEKFTVNFNKNELFLKTLFRKRCVKGMVSLQIVSDIHLEFRGKRPQYANILPQEGMDLVLAGDIGRPFMTGNNRNIHADFIGYCANTVAIKTVRQTLIRGTSFFANSCSTMCIFYLSSAIAETEEVSIRCF